MQASARRILRGLARRAPLLLAATVLCGARSERLALRHVALDLPGPPARLIATDLNDDGRDDLLVVVAYTEIEEIGKDRIENMVQITEVIPAVFDRREVRVYLSEAGGGYALAGTPLQLPDSILHMEPGAGGIVALTDEGLSRLVFTSATGALRLEPLIENRPLLARTGSFYSSLELIHDLDGDGDGDLLLPSAEGFAVYAYGDTGLAREPVERIELPGRELERGVSIERFHAWPTVRDIDGDGRPDLVFASGWLSDDPAPFQVYRGSGGGRFVPLRREPLDCHDRLTDLRLAVAAPEMNPWPANVTAIRDLDGDGRAEVVMSEERPRGDSFRKELKDAKRPIQSYTFHRLTDDLFINPEPYRAMRVVGHTMESGSGVEETPFHVEQFQDLDGDGREDLVTITLDFSIFQALKILATKKIGIGVDFHVYAQREDGSFEEVPDLDLSEKLKFDLDDLKVGRFGQFAGDFDGDGRRDFVHLGRGKLVTVHAGMPGCRYPRKPDLSIELDQEPPSLDLVKIEDLDGDGRSDLRITRPLPPTDVDTTAPVRLDLYLSRTGP